MSPQIGGSFLRTVNTVYDRHDNRFFSLAFELYGVNSSSSSSSSSHKWLSENVSRRGEEVDWRDLFSFLLEGLTLIKYYRRIIICYCFCSAWNITRITAFEKLMRNRRSHDERTWTVLSIEMLYRDLRMTVFPSPPGTPCRTLAAWRPFMRRRVRFRR